VERVKPAVGRVLPLIPALLLVSYPLLSLFEQNQTELELSVIWSPLAVSFAVTATLYVALSLLLRSVTKAGVLTALSVIWFFYWSTFKSDVSGLHLSDGWVFGLWLALLIACVVLVLKARFRLGTLVLGLGIFAVVLAVVPAVKIASYQSDHPGIPPTDPRLWPTALSPPSGPKTGARLPDIYVIVPDDYARADVLSRYFHYDNSPFLQQLRKRGFTVSKQGRSPYSDSESNIAAELNLDYLSQFPKVLGAQSQDVRPVKRVMEDNRAARLLRPLGYRYVHLDTDEVTWAGGNPDISSTSTPDSFTSLWLQKSVLRQFGGTYGFNDAAADGRYRDAIRTITSRLESVPTQPGPKLVFFHTLMPHDPYVFGAQGQPVTFPGHTDQSLASPVGRRYYLSQLQFASHELLSAIDAIQAKSATPPVIIVQSDEGFQANDQSFGEEAMRQIRVKGLLALYLPGMKKAGVPQPPTTVNTLRFVFDHYLGARYPMLPAASYPEGDYPYQYEPMKVK
jgi:hypothetical protein